MKLCFTIIATGNICFQFYTPINTNMNQMLVQMEVLSKKNTSIQQHYGKTGTVYTCNITSNIGRQATERGMCNMGLLQVIGHRSNPYMLDPDHHGRTVPVVPVTDVNIYHITL